jgi:hypothetical protein
MQREGIGEPWQVLGLGCLFDAWDCTCGPQDLMSDHVLSVNKVEPRTL